MESSLTHPQAPSAPPPREPAPSPWKRIGGGLATAGLVLAKVGAKLKLLLLFLPKLKILTTAGSMLVSVAAYSLIWGWTFALGFVVLLFVHEMGHVLQLRREGIKASAPLFIPFLGAVVGMKQMPEDAAAEARVGLAGPVLGSLGALACVGLYQATGDEFFKALAFVGFFLNLINLLPVLPLDGGRAAAALSTKLWIAGFVMLIAAGIFFPSPIILLVLLFGGMETYRRYKRRDDPESQAYYRVSTRNRWMIAAVYIGLAALLAAGMDATHLVRDFSDV